VRWANGQTLIWLSIMAIATFGTSAFAATSDTSFSVTATIPVAGQISVTSLSFRNYNETPTTATSTISIMSTDTTLYIIRLRVGPATTGVFVKSRANANAGTTLTYGLYRTAKHAMSRSNTAYAGMETGARDSLADTLTVFGKIPAGLQVAPPDRYDIIAVTMTY